LSESHKGYAFDIKQEQQLVKEHDRILIVIPLIWYSDPALLKKWLQDIFTDEFIESIKDGGKLWMISVTSGKPERWYRLRNNNAPLEMYFLAWQSMMAEIGQSLFPMYPYYWTYRKGTEDHIEAAGKLLAQFNSTDPSSGITSL
ncbi:MAG: NAD(P)H-dependent oxidoreductase, partial [Firmicutes bacterium]|nr:NAD(P)H-dependent oxidoreductase [Bacillota bacterium]